MSSSSSDSASSLYRRRAHHAGSWYQSDASALDATLQGFLDKAAASATTTDISNEDDSESDSSLLRAIICPHAGFSYSGPTAAYSYQALYQSLLSCNQPKNNKIKTILVLHPSHHVYINGCAVSGASTLETPLGHLPVNDTLRREILTLNTSRDCVFSIMTQSQDEEEHSGEMQYPFLAKVLQNVSVPQNENKNKSPTFTNGNSNGDKDEDRITVLPILCGSLSVQQEVGFGRLLSEIIHRPEVLTVVSTDFCHWGSRFSYRPACTTTTQRKNGQEQEEDGGDMAKIHELIEQLDRRGMSLIEAQEPGAFAVYLKETKNTICGRHAVAVWLRALEAGTTALHDDGQNGDDDKEEEKKKNAVLPHHTVRFIRYSQSSPVTAMHESSVSYASAIATISSS
jgi:MEMO1 family protein